MIKTDNFCKIIKDLQPFPEIFPIRIPKAMYKIIIKLHQVNQTNGSFLNFRYQFDSAQGYEHGLPNKYSII